ncbi:MAG: hypothetical protein EOO89_27770 [Pedobacter sp.]|nr:MAG: hypothetical protein EOO89_27770 [Pedobacter sp.]
MFRCSNRLAGFRHACIGLLVPVIFILSCNKNELSTPGQTPKSSRAFHFSFENEDQDHEGSVQLRISITNLDVVHGSSNIVWDTILMKNNIYELRKELFSVKLEDVKNALVNYTVVYNNGGLLTTRSGGQIAGETVTVKI